VCVGSRPLRPKARTSPSSTTGFNTDSSCGTWIWSCCHQNTRFLRGSSPEDPFENPFLPFGGPIWSS
jgi:hypothetical protein